MGTGNGGRLWQMDKTVSFGRYYSDNHDVSLSAASGFYNNMIGGFRNGPEVNRFFRGLLTPFTPRD